MAGPLLGETDHGLLSKVFAGPLAGETLHTLPDPPEDSPPSSYSSINSSSVIESTSYSLTTNPKPCSLS